MGCLPMQTIVNKWQCFNLFFKSVLNVMYIVNWRVTVAIPLVDSILTELDTRFATYKRAHFELCAVVPEVITKTESLKKL